MTPQKLHIYKYCNAETTQPDNECYAKPKRETLEEAAENYSKTFIEDDGTAEVDFIEGAKWQAKRMYSEGEVENILIEYVKTNPTKPYNVVSWFSKFKKK